LNLVHRLVCGFRIEDGKLNCAIPGPELCGVFLHDLARNHDSIFHRWRLLN